MEVISYKYCGISQDNKVVIKDNHGTLFICSGYDNYKGGIMVHTPLASMLSKGGFTKCDPVEVKDRSKIIVTPKGVRVDEAGNKPD